MESYPVRVHEGPQQSQDTQTGASNNLSKLLGGHRTLELQSSLWCTDLEVMHYCKKISYKLWLCKDHDSKCIGKDVLDRAGIDFVLFSTWFHHFRFVERYTCLRTPISSYVVILRFFTVSCSWVAIEMLCVPLYGCCNWFVQFPDFLDEIKPCLILVVRCSSLFAVLQRYVRPFWE